MLRLDHLPRLPVVGCASNPLLTLKSADMRSVLEGVTVDSQRPANAQGVLRCYLNNEPLYPITSRQMAYHVRLLHAGREEEARAYLTRAVHEARNWKNTTLRTGDVLVWHEVTQGRNLISALIVVAAVVYAVYTQDWRTAAQFAALAFAAENILMPPTLPRQKGPGEAPGDVFNTSLNGNEARLEQPIWKICGLTMITPPFAAQPYYEFVHIDGRDSDDQFYYAVFAVGIGNHDLLGAFIGKTPIVNFQDVTVAAYRPPGTPPSKALCNVVTSSEVSSAMVCE